MSQRFTCSECHRRVPWSQGADDDMPGACDECWGKAHEEVERLSNLERALAAGAKRRCTP